MNKKGIPTCNEKWMGILNGKKKQTKGNLSFLERYPRCSLILVSRISLFHAKTNHVDLYTARFVIKYIHQSDKLYYPHETCSSNQPINAIDSGDQGHAGFQVLIRLQSLILISFGSRCLVENSWFCWLQEVEACRQAQLDMLKYRISLSLSVEGLADYRSLLLWVDDLAKGIQLLLSLLR